MSNLDVLKFLIANEESGDVMAQLGKRKIQSNEVKEYINSQLKKAENAEQAKGDLPIDTTIKLDSDKTIEEGAAFIEYYKSKVLKVEEIKN